MKSFSSTSEKNVEYLDLSHSASIDDTIFNTFKSNNDYNEILEHVNQPQGQEYLNLITNPSILENIEKFKVNDLLGTPKKYTYDNVGIFSPTTLRYIKTLDDLIKNYNLENSNIIEIGCGYGGQYVVMKQLFNPKKYSFVDLPNVVPLIKTYLTKLNLLNNTEFIDLENPEFDEQYDLIISNYAISECNSEVQKFYLERILKNSTHGYMIHNQFNGLSLEEFTTELKNMNKNVKVVTEQPLTSPKNVLITW